MNTKNLRRIISTAAALCLCAALLGLGGSASGDIYVNGGDVLSGGIASAYAVTGDGLAAQIGSGEVYVMTSGGLQTVDGGGETAVTPDGPPEHLSVTGSIDIPYQNVRVGLYYYDSDSSVRNSTLPYANLENEVGSGYELGYYDEEREFHALGSTDETAITMVMDRNTDTDHGHVGCYHILLPGTYGSFEEASAAASAYPDGFPAYYDGVYRALVGDYDSAAAASADASSRGITGEAYSASAYCVVVTRTADASIIFEFDCGTEYSLGVRPVGENGEKTETWFRGYTYNGGFEYVRRTGGELTVVNIVDIEDYVKGVITYEMSADWPLEALKAQALCARTYVASYIGASTYYVNYGFDVTNDTYCQVYRGTNLSTEASDRAVDETAGIYITYDGEPISAMFSSSHGGGSEDSENITGSVTPYLRGVLDPYEEAAAELNSRSSWIVSFSPGELARMVSRSGNTLGSIESVEAEYSDTGNVIALVFTDSSGTTAEFEGVDCYRLCTATIGLSSIHFTVTDTGVGFAFEGSGWGHSLGMSQYGAYAMVDTYGYTYDQIINFYYTGVELARG